MHVYRKESNHCAVRSEACFHSSDLSAVLSLARSLAITVLLSHSDRQTATFSAEHRLITMFALHTHMLTAQRTESGHHQQQQQQQERAVRSSATSRPPSAAAEGIAAAEGAAATEGIAAAVGEAAAAKGGDAAVSGRGSRPGRWQLADNPHASPSLSPYPAANPPPPPPHHALIIPPHFADDSLAIPDHKEYHNHHAFSSLPPSPLLHGGFHSGRHRAALQVSA